MPPDHNQSIRKTLLSSFSSSLTSGTSAAPGVIVMIIFMAVMVIAYTQTRQQRAVPSAFLNNDPILVNGAYNNGENNAQNNRGEQYALLFAPGSDMTTNITALYGLDGLDGQDKAHQGRTYIVRSGFFENILIVQSSHPNFESRAKQNLTNLWLIMDPIFAGGCNPTLLPPIK